MTIEHLEILVEEPSMEICLHELLPKLLESGITFAIHDFQNKRGLLKRLPERLRAYTGYLPKTHRIIVLVDRDDDDCHTLKSQLETLSQKAGLASRSSCSSDWKIVNRIVIEELEAWFFGDPNALHAAYPKASSAIADKAPYRDPDAIRGGTAEALERVLRKVGYFRSGLRKNEAAREISKHLEPNRNTSHSFQVFRDTLLELRNQPPSSFAKTN